MNSSRSIHRWLFLAGLVLATLIVGCSQKHSAVAVNTSDFDSAPPELKQCWKVAAGCISQNNYLGAATNLMAMLEKSQGLTPQQTAALNKAWLDLGTAAFEAADRHGNKDALAAVLMIRNSKYNGSDGH